MTVYLVLIFIIFFFGLLIKPQDSSVRKALFLVFSFLCMFTVSAFRAYTVGSDTKTYLLLYDKIAYLQPKNSRYEVGFFYYVKFLHQLSNNPTLLLAVSSFICVGAACFFIYKFSDDPVLSVLLYIVLKQFFFQMTGMRQALATAFVLIAFCFVMNKRSLWRIIASSAFIMLAILFHNMSFIILIIYLIWLIMSEERKERITPGKTLGWTVVISLLSFALFSIIMGIVGFIAPQYVNYADSTWGDSNYFGSLFNMLIHFSFLAVGAYYCRDNDLEPKERFSFLMISMSVVVATLSMRMEIWGRLVGLFSIYTPLILAPCFVMRAKDDGNRMILRILVFSFSFAYMLITFVFRPEWDGVVPYRFISIL